MQEGTFIKSQCNTTCTHVVLHCVFIDYVVMVWCLVILVKPHVPNDIVPDEKAVWVSLKNISHPFQENEYAEFQDYERKDRVAMIVFCFLKVTLKLLASYIKIIGLAIYCWICISPFMIFKLFLSYVLRQVGVWRDLWGVRAWYQESPPQSGGHSECSLLY